MPGWLTVPRDWITSLGALSAIGIAGWSERTPVATLEATAALIDRFSRRIEDAIADVELAPPVPVAAAA